MFPLVSRYLFFCLRVFHIFTILWCQAHCHSTVVNLTNNTLPSNTTESISFDVISALLSYNVSITSAVNGKMSINSILVPYSTNSNVPDIFISATTVKSYYATIVPGANGSRYINPTSMSYNNTSIISSGGTINRSNFSATPSKLLPIVSSPINASFNSSPCYGKKKWTKAVYENNLVCLTYKCSYDMFQKFDLYMTCNDWSVSTALQVIGGYVDKYGIQRAVKMAFGKSSNQVKRKEYRVTTSHFKVEYGFIHQRFLIRSNPVPFPDLKYGEATMLNMPPTLVNSISVSYVYVEFFLNTYKHNEAVDYMEERSSLTKALYTLNRATSMSYVANVINSKIVSFLTRPYLTYFTEYVDIIFHYRDYKGTINHKCVHAPGHLGQVQWTNAGCYAVQVLMRSIHCRCNTPQSNYAVLSELYVEPKSKKAFKQETLTSALVIISLVGAFVCFLCVILPPCVGCSYVGGMIRIYRYSDLTQAVEYITFIIGVYSSRHETASSLIAVVLHFLHCSVMFWALIEGIYLYHKVKPQYHRSTGTMFFYSTLVFGTSAALTGAVAGYPFQFGTNIQYVWVKFKGIQSIYFLIPIIVLVLITIAIDWLLIMQLKNWIGFHDDYVYTRAPYFIRRQSGFVTVCLVTFIFGYMSMENDGVGYKSYLFAAFFAIQIICRFYSHFTWNYEVWGWKKFSQAHVVGERERVEGYDNIQTSTKQQHTVMMMETSSSEESEHEQPIEVERWRHRPTSVHTCASQSRMSEVEERTVTPRTDVSQVSRINRVNSLNTKIRKMNITEEEEKEDEFDEEFPKKKERKKFKVKDAEIEPRMTKAQLARMKKLEEEKRKIEEEKKNEEEVEREKEEKESKRKMSRRQSNIGMTQGLLK